MGCGCCSEEACCLGSLRAAFGRSILLLQAAGALTHSLPLIPMLPACLPAHNRYVAQHQAHTALLTQFGELSAALTAVPLPPQLAGVNPQWRVLADLQPRVRLAEWHESCSRSHEHFAQKVGVG